MGLCKHGTPAGRGVTAGAMVWAESGARVGLCGIGCLKVSGGDGGRAAVGLPRGAAGWPHRPMGREGGLQHQGHRLCCPQLCATDQRAYLQAAGSTVLHIMPSEAPLCTLYGLPATATRDRVMGASQAHAPSGIRGISNLLRTGVHNT